jgi:hypothetical protein
MEVGVARWKYVGIRVEDKSNTNNCIRDLVGTIAAYENGTVEEKISSMKGEVFIILF